MNLEDRVAHERQRLTALLFDCGISDVRMKAMETIIENVSWMRVKLDDTRDAIKQTGVAIPYDNGGGQKGIRENPLFKGYQSLFKSYMSGMEIIIACLPRDDGKALENGPETPKTVLELVRTKHQKQA